MRDGADLKLPQAPVIGIFTPYNEQLADEIRRLAPGTDLRQLGDLGDPKEIQAVICWKMPEEMLGRLSGLKLVQATGAGVDGILNDKTAMGSAPVCQTIDSAFAGGMAGYVSGAVFDHQREMAECRRAQRLGVWRTPQVVAHGQHRVGFAGVGALGSVCLNAVAALGFQPRAWSQSWKPESAPGCAQFVGDAELNALLEGCDTLVCLLPLTPRTSGFLCAKVFERLPRNAHVINVERGEHLVEQDLIDAIDRKHLKRATLDVFGEEPLPAGPAPILGSRRDRDHAAYRMPRHRC